MSKHESALADAKDLNAAEFRITQISPPVFPERVAIEMRGGVLKLAFVITPDLRKPNEVCIVADIIATPMFALGIAEQIIAMLRTLNLPSEPREEAIKEYLEGLTSGVGDDNA